MSGICERYDSTILNHWTMPFLCHVSICFLHSDIKKRLASQQLASLPNGPTRDSWDSRQSTWSTATTAPSCPPPRPGQLVGGALISVADAVGVWNYLQMEICRRGDIDGYNIVLYCIYILLYIYYYIYIYILLYIYYVISIYIYVIYIYIYIYV